MQGDRIIELYNQGKRTSVIAEMVGVTPRHVQRIIRERIGGPPQVANSRLNQLRDIRILVVQLLEAQGRDFEHCELCNDPIPEGKFDLHHTKYEGATLADILIVCRACNASRINQNLT